MTTTEITPSENGTVKCSCGARFFYTQRHVCDFYDNSATTRDPFGHAGYTPTANYDSPAPERTSGGTGSHTPSRRSNRYPGNCVKCGGRVEAEAGHLVKDNSRTGGSPWGVEHKIGQCNGMMSRDEAAEAAQARKPGGAPMSEAQEKFLRGLVARKTPDADVEEIVKTIVEASEPRKVASALIDALKAAPNAAKPAAEVEVELERRGDVHVIDGQYYRVHVAQNSGRLYACVWDAATESFEYAAGMIGKLNDGNKITAEQAAAFGEMFSRCCFCSHQLDTPESTAVGYGPVCAKKHDLPWG